MDNVLDEIKFIAGNYAIEKVVLFGSRARGDNSDTSDYDIAVYDNSMKSTDKACFKSELEEISTLKKIDVVFTTDTISDKLKENIDREGVVIFEQVTK